MKIYALLFVYGYKPYVTNIRKPYVINVREDELASAIKRELKKGALLSYIKEVKENDQ